MSYVRYSFTGLLTNFKSYVRYSYKVKLFNTLVDRVHRIKNTWKGFDLDVNNLTSALCKNLFPIQLVQKFINKHLKNKKSVEQINEKKSKNEIKTSNYLI